MQIDFAIQDDESIEQYIIRLQALDETRMTPTQRCLRSFMLGKARKELEYRQLYHSRYNTPPRSILDRFRDLWAAATDEEREQIMVIIIEDLRPK